MNHDTALAATTLMDLLRQRAETYRDKVAFSFSYDGDDVNRTELTYRDLDHRARAIASTLKQLGAAGERVLVLCRPGLDSIAGFFGCIYAGAVAVPVHERLAPRLSSVVPDADARFALATAETQAKIKAAIDELGEGRDLQWVRTDDEHAGAGRADRWVQPDLDPDAIAMVQYTSGSTTTPKGVALSHRNLLHNMESVRQVWHGDDTATSVFWLPSHHDMGLIGAILSMLYVGCTTHLMSPSSFVKRPMRWLEALSRHRATFTAAPNFAYERCVEDSTEEERAALDLSNLATAMNGAEPVQAATLHQFAEAFAPAGFRPEAFCPVYGLAEATLLVSGGSDSALPVVRHIDRTGLQVDRVVDAAPGDPSAVAVVGCGQPRGGQRVVIVDPVTHRPCEADEVGEIWIAGPSVGQGYWARPEETEQTFAAVLPDASAGPFLRTGDLGFLRSGELFITGRCKDLVVIRGGNHYPNDIERTVQGCHPALVSGRGATFAITPGLGAVEQLVVVQEVDQQRDPAVDLAGMAAAVRTAVTERYGIEPNSVLLVRHLSIPTTSSGKIQRGQCRRQFLDGEITPVAHWSTPSALDDLAKARELEAAVQIAELIKAEAARQQAVGSA
ncbi:fatty acyl-AMP ligase [Mycolicibacterium neworleansense]|uniref:Fatty-acid--CoA ligase n=1 Tax=Mycolicibacterium neworleansense TaxID=146018 RepID=A0A0H5S3E5_9MYCO|nr:fatty acyl-AMP ligase [Mycolicibacterium neworleansense]MCV7364825.1 fatty acyl-AMP ligase [Mycolicibacterium neworleansense]CRZ15619.1 fatty-acid--CoA ligase [Mycolicibacterium neworleansense]